MEENRRFSWSNLFIKVIIVIIFILFVIWLLSLSNRRVTNSLEVLTDEIFAENIEKMKNVGKEYFTIERLPEKVGDIEILTLQEMYDKKLILPIKDKNGNECDADDSYVTIEKFDNEYQMKVNLECEGQEDYIIVIMGCYDYCDTDICEKEEEVKEDESYVKGETTKKTEYEYVKTTGGKWSDYGSWSEWSKVTITETSYRQVETKKVNEEYTYDKIVTEVVYETLEATCPKGYVKTSDGTKCYKSNSSTVTEKPVCPSVTGFTLTSQDGFTCNYSKTTTSTKDPVCPAKSGWSVSRSGFTCNYSTTVSTPYQVAVTNSATCYSQKVVKPCSSCAPVTQNIPYDCSTTSYVTQYKTETKTDTGTASCPTGFSKSGNTCAVTSTETDTRTASCPTGFTKSGNACTKTITETDTRTASCSTGFTKIDNTCSKTTTTNDYEDIIKSCPTGYEMTDDETKCYKNVENVVKVTGTKSVTYYRYRVREYIGGSTDYKWSTSKNDKELLDAGYKLTGKTR